LGRRFGKNNLSAPKIAPARFFFWYSKIPKNLNFVVTKTQSSLIVRSFAAEDLEWVEEAEDEEEEEEEEEKWLLGEQVGLCKPM
jgi:tRNA U34 2-thiouridine synthase MnmA/TrmU